MQTSLPSTALRDPAAPGRLATLLLSAVLLWPLLVWTEFKPWELFDSRSLKATWRFVSDFVPPRHVGDEDGDEGVEGWHWDIPR